MGQVEFPAMGTSAHVIVAGGPPRLAETARARLGDLEARWSRFRPDSEISRLNRGGWVRISSETGGLIDRGLAGWERTGGRFDPTVQRSMVALGYDRDLAEVVADGPTPNPSPAPGCSGIERAPGMARLPDGVGFDPGGIGKGFAADLVAAELVAAGATAALVNIGGDLCAAGTPEQGGWGIRVSEPAAGVATTIGIAAGAVATSTPVRRRWRAGGVPRHHLLDPSTGEPLGESTPLLVSVVAGEGWWAEVCTKAAMLTPAPLLSGMLGEAAAMVVYRDGSVTMVNGMEEYLS